MRFIGAVCAAICVLFIYLLIPTKTYYWDGVLFSFYAEQARQGQMAVTSLFHANHLIYTLFAWIISVPGVRTIRVLQAANAVAGALCALLVFVLAKRVTTSNTAAYAGMLLFAFGATWWKFATDADAYIISVLFCLAAIWFVLRKDRVGLATAITCHVIAMLFHELAVFLYFPMLFAVTGMRRRLIYLSTTAAAINLAYWGAFLASGHPGHATFLSWVTSYAGDTPVTHSVQQILFGYFGSYLKLFAGGKFSLVRQFIGPLIIVGFVISACLLAVSIRLWKLRPIRAEINLVPVLLAWLIPLAIFLAVFDPASTFHKLFLWPPLVLLICAFTRQRASAMVALAGALACWNFSAFIWPHAQTGADPILTFAEDLNRQLPSQAVVYYAAFSPDDWYLRYFGPAETWKPLPIPAHPDRPVCVETTALGSIPQLWSEANSKWSLITPQHNVRIACLKPRLSGSAE